MKFVLFICTVLAGLQSFRAQTDTLHLYYNQVQTTLHDTSLAKLDKWVKSLNGRHVDIQVLAYYSRPEFKVYSQTRADEMFLTLNRKARSLITIQFIGPKKGKNSQRSTVDIVYTAASANDVATTTEPKKVGDNASTANSSNSEGSSKSESGAQKEKTGKTGNGKENANANAKDKVKADKPAATGNSKNFIAKEQFKNRKMLVVLLEENELQMEMLTENEDKEGLQSYKNNIQNYNSMVQKAFKNGWKESEVSFVTDTEIRNGNLAEMATQNVFVLPGKQSIENIPFLMFTVSMAKGKITEIYQQDFKVALSDAVPQMSDFSILMNKMKVFYELTAETDLAQLEQNLKAKTLLIDKDLTDLSNEDLKSTYPYPFMLGTSSEITEQMNKNLKGVLILKRDLQGNAVNMVIYDAETGATLSRTTLADAPKPTEKMPERNNSTSGLKANAGRLNLNVCTTCAFADTELIKKFPSLAKLSATNLSMLTNPQEQAKNKKLTLN